MLLYFRCKLSAWTLSPIFVDFFYTKKNSPSILPADVANNFFLVLSTRISKLAYCNRENKNFCFAEFREFVTCLKFLHRYREEFCWSLCFSVFWMITWINWSLGNFMSKRWQKNSMLFSIFYMHLTNLKREATFLKFQK